MHVANVLHGKHEANPADAHEELPPGKVGRPGAAKKVAQLLVDWIVFREAQSRQLQNGGVGRIRPGAVSKDGLDLHIHFQAHSFSYRVSFSLTEFLHSVYCSHVESNCATLRWKPLQATKYSIIIRKIR